MNFFYYNLREGGSIFENLKYSFKILVFLYEIWCFGFFFLVIWFFLFQLLWRNVYDIYDISCLWLIQYFFFVRSYRNSKDCVSCNVNMWVCKYMFMQLTFDLGRGLLNGVFLGFDYFWVIDVVVQC